MLLKYQRPLSLLLVMIFGGTRALFFEDGFDHHYTFSSESDILGLHNVTTVVKFRIRRVNDTGSDRSLHMLIVDSFTQRAEKGYFADNPMKWDLDKEFLFTVGGDGLVTMVYFHPEDKHEILSLKKVLASTLSLRVEIQETPNWRFTSTERDHAGILEHEYEAERTSTGLKFVRTHRSSNEVNRHHMKTSQLDHRGTPFDIESLDNVTLHSDKAELKRKFVEGGEEDILDQQSGGFPKISSISKSKVKLSAKRPHNSPKFTSTAHLTKDILLVKKKAEAKVSLVSLEEEIKKQIKCVHLYSNKFERNRTECVNKLRQLLLSLHRDDFLKLSTGILKRTCDADANTTMCLDERNLFIDMIAHEGSPDAQKLLVDQVVLHPNVSEDDIRRFLFHCIALKYPLPEVVEVVENMCHGGIEFVEGAPSFTKNGKRACLSLGAIAKSLHDTNITKSDLIVERLESWLEIHNETKSSEIIKPRRRRSIAEYDRASRKHIETKTVLLQSLGNAGKQRSLNHIKSYLEPNMGISVWRRAAANSLRHFTCNESATALLKTAVHDDDTIVRETAITVLETHPQSKRITQEQADIVLSKNYTYPIVARVRRDLLQTLIQGISVHIEPPGIEWEKTIGTQKIGASFGLHVRNILDLKLGLLDGHFMVDVFDDAHAEAHVGLLNFKVEIVKASICFKGHIEYNLNVLKDFGINSLQDLVNVYDKIVGGILDPINRAIKNFNDIIHLFKNGGIQKIFNTLVSTVKNLPHILGEVAVRLKEFVKEVFSIAGSTIIDEIKHIVNYVRQFVDGVKQDLLKFYHSAVDPVTMALPYIGKKITEAFNLIVSGFKSLLDNPMQAISSMFRAITDIKMAIAMVADVKGKIVEACMFLKGRAAEWFSTAKEIPKVIKRLQDAIQKLVSSVIHRRSLADDMENTFNNGVQSMKEAYSDLKADLKRKWDLVVAPIRGLMDVAKPFIDEFKAIVDLIKGVKDAYKTLKEVIEIGKGRIQKVFGPKFDPKFPTYRRPKKGNCKEGVWPTTTNDHYQTTGVDLTIGSGQTIVAPVDCIVHVKSENKVVIETTSPEFAGQEIVIENIIPEKKADGKRFKAGKKIGKASRVGFCEPNFIHVSVRKTQNITKQDSDYDYIDPSSYLDRLIPVPKWIQECNDHEFRYIGQTHDSGESTDGEPKSATEKLKRAWEDSIGSHDDLDSKMGDEDTAYRPDDDGLYESTSFGDSLKNSLKEQAAAFAEFFKTALFSKDGPKVPNILEIVNVNGKSVQWILDKLDNGSVLSQTFSSILQSLKHCMTEIPSGNPSALSLPYMRRILSSQGISSSIGGIADAVAHLTEAAEQRCPGFKGAIAASFGHMCTARCDCLGLTCSIALQHGYRTEYLNIEITLDVDDAELTIVYNGTTIHLAADGEDHEIGLSVKVLGMTASLVVQLSRTERDYSLSLEAKLCSDLLLTCLPPVHLLSELKFPTVKPDETADCKDGGVDHASSTVDHEIHAMSIPAFINALAEYNKLNHDVTNVLDNVRTTVVKRLMEDAVDKIVNITKEFKDKVDFCLSANIPVPPFDITFFDLRYHFMVGPVPLSLGFGAGGSVGFGVKLGFCVLSMTVKTTLTPWVGGKVYGDVAVDIGFARGGVRLKGFLLETKFPITVELVFSKYPLDIGSKMDLVLTPIRLELVAFAELRLIFTTVTVFEGTFWHYKAPTIQKNIFTKHKRDEDKSPPELQPHTVNKRKKREGQRGCSVQQIPGRPFYDTAFKLEMFAEDPVSDVKLSYAVGSHRGGTDLIDWTEMGGPTLLVPAKLPGGIPLYWTVKAKNSQSLEAITQCSLDTYDSTLPDGRVEHSYKCSSHPNKLLASVIVFDDSPLVDTHHKAVGYSTGKFGSQFVDWQEINLSHSAERPDISGYLRKFTVPREGKLVSIFIKTQKTSTPEECARLCINHGSNCVSFDYETHSETCDFHDVVQGANAYLRLSGTYKHYERLGSGYHTPIEYTNLPLQHGNVYFVNVHVKNILGYDAFLVGEGTMIDFIPPEPGLIRNASLDIMKADNCTAAVTQRCLDVTWKDNHRIIIDGPGSATIFSGHKPLFDELYTLTNHYISANWHGFHDDQCGIWGYTWAVGRQICGTDILAYTDPYSHLSSKRFWTDSGFKKGFHLTDGSYYVTVQALNDAELGGSLVTTVCHSTPFTVDTTPPVFSGVTDIIYDEDFDLIAIYYAASDDLSKIAKAEFGLGKTKYDVQLKAYSLHEAMTRDNPFVSLKELGLQEGIPAWIRIRVTNNVDLFTAGHGDEPILIDKSPPIVGTVLDGDKLQRDLQYQADDKRICAQWVDFYDPQSGIDRFLWGVGTKAGLDNVVKFRNLTQYDKSACAPAALTHNNTYYSTVLAYNNALNSKATNGSSDGVLVDTTPPLPGHVVDGKPSDTKDMEFSSETVTKTCHWNGYHDPESGIDKYTVSVYINNELKETFDVGTKQRFEDKTISLEHTDFVRFTVYGVNGAGLSTAADSNGFMVDHTPPIMTKISDTDSDTPYQNNNTALHLKWNFKDDESGIKEYRTVIYELKEGVKQKFWPRHSAYNKSEPLSSFSGNMDVVLDKLALEDGGQYSLHVTSINGALLSTAHESAGVVVDTTPPKTPKVHIGLIQEEEDLNEKGQVLHDDQESIRVSWSGRDPESGIKTFIVAIGTPNDTQKVYPFTRYGKETTAKIRDIHFNSSVSGITYVVAVQAENGAGILSDIGYSKPIYVQKANVPGTVFDGRTVYHDSQYTIDKTSLAASFYGFESESCNILGYEWAIGTEAYGTNVLSYTNYGIVMQNHTHGYMQIHTELYENTKYFVTVRAVTGCRDQYILSSSDGIVLDTSAPSLTFEKDMANDTELVLNEGVWYQDNVDTISVLANATDAQSIDSANWAIGSLPLQSDLKDFTDDFLQLKHSATLVPGESNFITGRVKDDAGNEDIGSSQPIIGDSSPPVITGLECTNVISLRQALVTCTWEKVIELESFVKDFQISIGTEPQLGNILFEYNQPETKRNFIRDMTQILKKHVNQSSLFIDFKITNIVGRRNDYEKRVVVDKTPPFVAGVKIVTKTNSKQERIPLKCQVPTSYVELQIETAEDMESEIDETRFQVALGTTAFSTDILTFRNIQRTRDSVFFVDGLTLHTGTIFHATIRSYNKAGLFSDASSAPVVVSQSPYLEVFDGPSENDIDFQSVPNIIQGRWKYSDSCPILSAEWKIMNIIGDVVYDYRVIPEAGERFYNDEVRLQNGVKYFVVVKSLDALNRTKIASSDGISVRIQPPFPGRVRDGKDEDLNYQFSTTDLSANWDQFGDNSNDPTQVIDHYEVAVGNDRRYTSTRSNVYFFVNVGLNTSHTFKHLNLTAKTVRYYITVRSYSVAGGFAEGYSNGIRVGYEEAIIPGKVYTRAFQTSRKSIAISWGDYQSDIGIVQYKVALSSHENIATNDTLPCSEFSSNESMFDISPLKTTGLDEFIKLDHLNLKHGVSYYPTIVAEDESGMCTAVSGRPVLIDTTQPVTGDIFINGLLGESLLFAKKGSEMHIDWRSFSDPESGISSSKVTLLECNECDTSLSTTCVSVAESTVQVENKTSFYELELVPNKIYIVNLVVTNGAGSFVSKNSSIVLLDTSPPAAGVVKITDDWTQSRSFQSEQVKIQGKIAIGLSDESYICSSRIRMFPTSNSQNWNLIDDKFSKDFSTLNTSGAYLGIGYNGDFSEITKSGISSPLIKLIDGNYSFAIRTAPGYKIITTLAFISGPNAIPYSLNDKPSVVNIDYTLFDNKTGLAAAENDSLVELLNETTTVLPDGFIQINETGVSNTSVLEENDFGFGIHLLGYKIGNNNVFHGLFWVQTKFSSVERWFQLNFEPNERDHFYSISTKHHFMDQQHTTDLMLYVDEQEVVNINGLKLGNLGNIAVLTWNEDNFEPPIQDVFHPFYTEAILRRIDVPEEKKKMCLHGKPFFDGESGIKEIWAGISDSETMNDNIKPFQLVQKFCYLCQDTCHTLCMNDCNDTKLNVEYSVIDIIVTNLNLQEVVLQKGCLNVTNQVRCNSTSYYLTTKVVNFAGQSTIVHSNAIQIDKTPPICDYMKCLDPEYSIDEPTSHLGSSSTIGAYWKCFEDVSLIDHYEVYVTSLDGNTSLMEHRNVGTTLKTSFKLANDSFIDKDDYMVHLNVTNTAGLYSVYNCTVHVNLYPPNVSYADTMTLFATDSAMEDEPASTDSQSQIGIKWKGGNEEVRFYEWQLGSQPEGEDIFPALKVGVNETGAAAIVHGKLELNEMPINKTIAEFHKNQSTESIAGKSIKEKAFFYLEPGRCIYQTLNAIGWSHLKSKIRAKTVCIKRPQDVEVTRAIGKQKQVISKSKLSDAWNDRVLSSSEKPEIVIEASLTDGRLSAGTLSQDDKTASYGSAATSDFKSYISDPGVTGIQTSRILRNRIVQYCNVSFFVAPSPVLHYNKILINITLPDTCKEDSEYQPALIFWDPDKEQWRHIDEGCFPYLTARGTEEVYTSDVCSSSNNGSVHENRRSTSTVYSQPRDFELTKIKRTFPNNPPNITTTEITGVEDTNLMTTISTFDAENDVLVFEITKNPQHADCQISTDGTLNCTLEDDFYGEDEIVIKITESGLPLFERPYSHEKPIPMHISPVPDKTERFFIDFDGEIHREKRPFMKLDFQVDANATETFEAGAIILADVDGSENFDYTAYSRFISLNSSTFSLEEVVIAQIGDRKRMLSSYRTLKVYKVKFTFLKAVNGKMTLNFIAVNQDGEYTPSVTINLHVLMNPCVHGSCSHKVTGPKGCDSLSRAVSFDQFICICSSGYTDQWCQTDINECAPEPCALMFDCEDLVNDYSCNINIPKLMAILLCSLVAVAGLCLLISKVFKRYKEKYRKIRQSNVSLMNSSLHDLQQIRPSSSLSIFTERSSTNIPPVSHSGQKIANALSLFENDDSFSPSQTDNSYKKSDFALSSLSMFGPGMAKPSHHGKVSTKDAPKELKLVDSRRKLESILERDTTITEGEQPGGSEHVDDMMGGIMLQERSPSRLTDIDV